MFVSDALSRLLHTDSGPPERLIPISFLCHYPQFTLDSLLHHYAELYDHSHSSPRRSTRLQQKSTQNNKPTAEAVDSPSVVLNSKSQIRSREPRKQHNKLSRNRQCGRDLQELTTTQLTDKLISQPSTFTEEQSVTLRSPNDLDVEPIQQLVSPDRAVTAISKTAVTQKDIDRLLKVIQQRLIKQWQLPITGKRFIQAYKTSPRYRAIYLYLTHNVLPTNAYQQKGTTNEAANYAVVEGLLFRIPQVGKKNTQDFTNPLLVVPEVFEPLIFSAHHGNTMCGHQGIQKTTNMIKQHFWIVNLFAKITAYVKGCDVCQRSMKALKPGNAISHGRIPMSYTPMARLSADVKFMPKARTGHSMCLVVSCEMTNFTIVIPIPNRQAETIAEALHTRVISWAGIPQFLNIDEDRAFTGNVIALLTAFYGMELAVISPWNHGSLKVERQIKTFQEIMIKFLTGKGDNWPMFTPQCTMAMNMSPSESLGGYTPYELVFLRPPRDPLNVNFQQLLDTGPLVYPEYVRNLKERQVFLERLMAEFRETQAAQLTAKQGRTRRPEQYHENELVALLSPTHSSLQTGTQKFKQEYVGPLVIQTILDDTHALLRTLDDRVLPHVYHINRLRHWQTFHPDGNIRTQKELMLKANQGLHPQVQALQNYHDAPDKMGALLAVQHYTS